MDKTMTVLSNS